MDSVQFTYWLQGALELGQVRSFNEDQVRIIQDHLDLVFDKVTLLRVPKDMDKEALFDFYKNTITRSLEKKEPGYFINQPTFDLSKVTC